MYTKYDKLSFPTHFKINILKNMIVIFVDEKKHNSI